MFDRVTVKMISGRPIFKIENHIYEDFEEFKRQFTKYILYLNDLNNALKKKMPKTL